MRSTPSATCLPSRRPTMTLTALGVVGLLASVPGLAHPAGTDGDDEEGLERVHWSAAGFDATDEEAPPPDGLLIDLADDLDDDDVADLAEETGLPLKAEWDVETGRRLVLRGSPELLARAQQVLANRDEVESVELNVFYSLIHDPAPLTGEVAFDDDTDPARPAKPNDPMYKHQWHFDMVNAEGAWSRTAGQGVIVAVLDTGVSPGKLKNGKKSRYKRVPDLNETEIVPGWNFVSNNADPSDGNAHGTHVAGTIAQSTNNKFGVAGLAYKAKIMPIKVLSDRGWGSVGAIASGIRWAADNGAQVINMSLGGGGYSKSMAQAVAYARKKGVVVVCAAGNGGRQKVEYPAAYPEAFAVSALGPDGTLAFYSSYGKELAIAAPGGDTRVDLNKDGIPDGVLQDTIARGDPARHGFFPFQGTSMATPHVAAAAALVMSTGVTDPDRVEKILKESARDLKDPIKYGAGGLDVAAAVKMAQRSQGGFALGLAALLGFALIRRNRRKDPLATFRPGVGFIGGLVMASSGLFLLHEVSLGDVAGLSLLASPLASWPGQLLGAGWHLNALVGSAALALVPLTLLFGFKKLRGVLAGLAVGFAGYLLARAVLGDVDVRWIPGHGMLDASWLALNGVITAFLGRVAMMRD